MPNEAPTIVFNRTDGQKLTVNLVEDGIDVEDSDSDSKTLLSLQEAEHLHAWLEVVLQNHFAEGK